MSRGAASTRVTNSPSCSLAIKSEPLKEETSTSSKHLARLSSAQLTKGPEKCFLCLHRLLSLLS